MISLGFTPLPVIIWRKQTNAPNKFMGSGMLPAGAYVTLEHEYILIFRKGEKRTFTGNAEKTRRRTSAIFWEERNNWFSDVWMDLKGTVQKLEDKKARERSAAYPFELPYRLICMFSAKQDMVLDPFLGTGTTMLAAIAAGRNSIGFELDQSIGDTIHSRMKTAVEFSNAKLYERLENHVRFIENRLKAGKEIKHANQHYGFPVITQQERELLLNNLISLKKIGRNAYEAEYSEDPQNDFIWNQPTGPAVRNRNSDEKRPPSKKRPGKPVQLSLL
jgi:DNA modification methylase